MNNGCSSDESLGKKIDVDNDSSGSYKGVEGVNEKANELPPVTPEIGMKFNSVEEMFLCFKKYAKYKGFTARKQTSKKDENGLLRSVTFACSGGGKNDCTPPSMMLRQRSSESIGCRVKLTSSFGRDGKWRINRLVLEHNHELSPRNWLCRCCGKNDEHVAGMGRKENGNLCGVEEGGNEKLITSIDKDCGNTARKLRLGEGDSIAIRDFFVKMQGENLNFFYSMDLDEDGRLKNVFWADGWSREACKEFGDVVTFDTTYLANNYDMPFATFVGVNHHGQLILLGCCLISSETTETFVWLFKTWRACMSDTDMSPHGIITDQDLAMQNAIEIVFPTTTKHRWCLWHVMEKFHKKFGSHAEYESINTNLQEVVYDTQNSEEFERGWSLMLDKFELHDNTWLSGLYKERHRWVPCFVTAHFWAGMSTTQRSEGIIKGFFDGYVYPKTTLKQFVEQYNHALEAKMHKENRADFKTFSRNTECATTYGIEKQFQGVYTFKKFKEVQMELTGMLYCDIVETRETCNGKEFDVEEDVAIVENYRKLLRFTVLFGKEKCEVSCSCSCSCSCRRFEFRGILCKHALFVLIKNKVTVVPDKYIIDRWRKDIMRSHTRIRFNYDGGEATAKQLRYKKMSAEFSKVAYLASDDAGCCSLVMEWIESKKKDLYSKKYHVTLKSTKDTNNPEVHGSPPSRTKARSDKQRIQAWLEASSKKSNPKARPKECRGDSKIVKERGKKFLGSPAEAKRPRNENGTQLHDEPKDRIINSQQGYHPPGPPTSWVPRGALPMQQQPGYGYMQPRPYLGAVPPYTQTPPYAGYPPQPFLGCYRTSAPLSQQVMHDQQQVSYGELGYAQPPAQTGYIQLIPCYGPPQWQEPPPGQAAHIQSQPPPYGQGSTNVQSAPVQMGDRHSQPPATQSGSAQSDNSSH